MSAQATDTLIPSVEPEQMQEVTTEELEEMLIEEDILFQLEHVS
jgi:hypothetical protein